MSEDRKGKLAIGGFMFLLGLPIYCVFRYFNLELIMDLGEIFMIVGIYEILLASLGGISVVAWFRRLLKR